MIFSMTWYSTPPLRPWSKICLYVKYGAGKKVISAHSIVGGGVVISPLSLQFLMEIVDGILRIRHTPGTEYDTRKQGKKHA